MCNKFTQKYEERESSYVRLLKNQIQNAQLSARVMKLINEEYSYEEQNAFLNKLTEDVNSGKVNMSSVILRDSSGTSKKITLDDVWKDNRRKSR